MDQGTIKYQVWNDELYCWWPVNKQWYDNAIASGKKVRKRPQNEAAWTEPGPPYQIDGDLTT